MLWVVFSWQYLVVCANKLGDMLHSCVMVWIAENKRSCLLVLGGSVLWAESQAVQYRCSGWRVLLRELSGEWNLNGELHDSKADEIERECILMSICIYYYRLVNMYQSVSDRDSRYWAFPSFPGWRNDLRNSSTPDSRKKQK